MKKIILLLLVSTTVLAGKANRHAPIGVMLDHIHQKDEVMLSYRFMYMDMNQLSKDAKEFSEDEFFNDSSYMMAPKNMIMKMHMLGGMYGLTDKLTINIMTSFIENEMTMIRRMGRSEQKSESSAIGDTRVNALYGLIDEQKQSLILSFGVNLPTGSVDEKDNGMTLGYPMQTGTGSYGIQSSLTYTHFINSWSFGGQLSFKTMLEDNEEDFRVGDRYEVNIWGSYQVKDSFSFSVRLNHNVQDIFEFDSNRTTSPPVDFKTLNGEWTNAYIGINYLNTGNFKGHRLALEYGGEIDSNYSGFQLKRDKSLILGWQKKI